MRVRAYCLLSGGIDSILAVKLLQLQGIETIGLHFKSFFFDKSSVIEQMGKDLNFEIRNIDITSEHLEILKNPRYGYGKTMNPCIDCHSLMAKKAGDLLDLSKKEFLCTGEVLGQRPMSQNKNALLVVEKNSFKKGLLLRPLSAKLMRPTIPEELGWVNRDLLLDIVGRRRERQMQLLKEWNIPLYASPGGGCKLTEATFTQRIKVLKDRGDLESPDLVKALSFGRLLDMGEHRYMIVSRKEREGIALQKIPADFLMLGGDTMGPAIIGWGNFSGEDILFAGRVFSFYAKHKGLKSVKVLLDYQKEIEIPAFDPVLMDQEIKKRIL